MEDFPHILLIDVFDHHLFQRLTQVIAAIAA
jgi:hypothetical protein